MSTGTTKLYDEEDVAQEAELAKLSGSKATRTILRKKLSRVWVDNLELMDYVSIPEPPESEHAKLEWLLEWASDTEDPRLLQIIQTFALDPDSMFDVTLQALSEIIELHEVSETVQRERYTYSQMISNALPATYADLLSMLGRERIKRPAATLRQWLRRHKGDITYDEFDRIIHKNPQNS